MNNIESKRYIHRCGLKSASVNRSQAIFPKGRINSALRKVSLILFLTLTSCSYSIDRKELIGNWNIEIERKLENGNWESDEITFFKMSTIPNVFKYSKFLSFHDDGVIELNSLSTDRFPEYYLLDESSQTIYMSLDPIEGIPTQIDRSLFVFHMKVNNNTNFSLTTNTDSDVRLVLNKQ
ncbi:hypothetical protein LX97_02811 [Nonlabens dokdonensis]|uniref:Lipocalin-like domain-containing protein n=2 Tax=Nonlabens dokdonensis TaxID=328515 RepID=L7WEW3_NONDD|nr:hypothetical protein DDD_3359 [Nonlabens dokdonensis DSW-6]PZX38230.1 hypothetical protein LX97_02811 [Nonlabens dokdonensis]